MSAQDRSQPTMTPTPLQRFIVVAAVVLSLLPAACVATIPFVPYGTANGDTRFTPGYNDRVYGPFPLPIPMPFPDGETQSEYYPTTTGGIFFKPIASATYVYDYTTYSSTYGPMIGAATSHMHNDATDSSGGYYHRTISGPGAALDALWSDVLPGGIPIVPTAGLVFTVDNSYLYAYPDTTSFVSTQTIVLWNSASTLMLFRIKNIVYSSTAVIHYGGYLAPNSFYSIPGAATTWASSSNTGVDGLYSALPAQPSKTPVPSPTATPKPSASPSFSSFTLSPSQTLSDTKSYHSTSPSPTASILVSLTKLTPSMSLSPTTSSSKSLSKTLLPSATAQSPSLSVSPSPTPSMSLSHTVAQSVTVSISESSSMSLSKTIPRSASAESPSLSASQSKSSMSLSHTVAQSASESISESSSKSLSKTIPSSLTAQSPSLSVTRSVSTISFSSSPSVTASPSTTSTGTLHRTFSNSSSPSRSGPTNSNSASHSRTLRVSLSQSLPTPTTSHSVSSSDKYEADGAGWQTIVMIAVPGIAGLAIVFGAILAVKHLSAGVTMTSAAAGAAGSLPPPPPASSSLPF